MNKKTTEEAKVAFRQEILQKLKIPEPIYKILECIFRHCLMLHTDRAGYIYEDDTPEKTLFQPGIPLVARMKNFENYITRWEARTKMVYGLELVLAPETAQHEIYVREYNELLPQVLKLQKYGQILPPEEMDALTKQLQKQLKRLCSVNDRESGGKYLSFNPGTKMAELEIRNFEYFPSYFDYAYAIFEPFFAGFEYEDGLYNSKIFWFLSEKVKFEHSWLFGVDYFTPKRIGDRIKKSAEKRIDLLRDDLKKAGLLSENITDFIDHLVQIAVKSRPNRYPTRAA